MQSVIFFSRIVISLLLFCSFSIAAKQIVLLITKEDDYLLHQTLRTYQHDIEADGWSVDRHIIDDIEHTLPSLTHYLNAFYETKGIVYFQLIGDALGQLLEKELTYQHTLNPAFKIGLIANQYINPKTKRVLDKTELKAKIAPNAYHNKLNDGKTVFFSLQNSSNVAYFYLIHSYRSYTDTTKMKAVLLPVEKHISRYQTMNQMLCSILVETITHSLMLFIPYSDTSQFFLDTINILHSPHHNDESLIFFGDITLLPDTDH